MIYLLLNKVIIQIYYFLKKILVFTVFFAILLCSYTNAAAYVLQGPHLLDLMIKKYGAAERLSVAQKLIFYDNTRQSGKVEIDETLSYVFSEEFRSDILSENTRKIHIVSKGRALTIIDGTIADNSESVFDVYKDLILYRSRIILKEKLNRLGIDTSISSLGRFGDKTAYIVGAQYPDESVSQVWIDKETFRPFRCIISKNKVYGKPDVTEFRYVEWRQFANNWYPIRIEIYQNNILLREIIAGNVNINPFFSNDFFNITKLRLNSLKTVPAIQQRDSKELNEIQKTIEDFKRIYK